MIDFIFKPIELFSLSHVKYYNVLHYTCCLLHSGARSLWNLDLCVLLIPALSELIVSKYERFVMSTV